MDSQCTQQAVTRTTIYTAHWDIDKSIRREGILVKAHAPANVSSNDDSGWQNTIQPQLVAPATHTQ